MFIDRSIDPTAEQVRALRDVPDDRPITMVNLLKFRAEASCARCGPSGWFVDDRLTQADITVACILTLLHDALQVFDGGAYAGLASHRDRCEALAEFQATRARWFAATMPR